jgi:signal transduction histidine kinase
MQLLDALRGEFLLRERELELLHETDLRILSKTDPLDKTLEFIAQGLRRLLGCQNTHVLLKRGSFLESVYSADGGDVGQQVPIKGSITGRCLLSVETVRIDDLFLSEHRDSYVPIEGYAGPRMRSILAVPILLDGSPIGVLNNESATSNAFAPVHERICEAVASQIQLALQHANLFEPSQLFARIDRLIFEQDPETPVLQRALDEVLSLIRELKYVDVEAVQILFMKIANSSQLEIVSSTQPDDIGLVVAVEDSVCGRAIKNRQTVTVGDVTHEPKYKRILGNHIRSEIAIPILLGDEDLPIGVLNVESREPDAFSGLYGIILDRFAHKVSMLLAFAKLRSDVTRVLDQRKADDLLVAVGDQTSNMVHRLNNDVGAMRACLQEIQLNCKRQLDESTFLASAVEDLLRSADRVLEMPQRLRHFLAQETYFVDMNECVHNAVDRLTLPSNVSLKLTLAPDLPPVRATSLDLVVENLARNAIDAMPDSRPGHIHISTAATKYEGTHGYLQLTVADDGIGMDAEVKSRLFELNFTTKSEREGKGLGIGMWWVRNLVLRARGDITMESSPGAGTVFTVKIPTTAAEGSPV